MKHQKIIDNRYRIIKQIGEGGFATVYKAWASNLERFVAVKKINESYSKEAKFLDMFRTEAVNTAKLDNQNIVRVIDFLRTSENIYYIIMEYVHGKDLRYLLQQCRKKNMRIPFGLCLYVICETLKALEYAYNLTDEIERKPLQIVHRDISPGNIMIYYDGRVKLTDFGIAQVSSKFGKKTEKGLLRGKVSYMSPEQANANPTIDNRSDIFSIGIVLYEILTGKRLLDGKSDYEIWTLAKKAKVNLALVEKAAHIPAPIKAILQKALKRNPEERYATANEMIRDIMNFFGDSYHIQSEGLKEFLMRCLPDDIAEDDITESIPEEETVPPPAAEHVPETVPQKEPQPEKPLVSAQGPLRAPSGRELADSEKTVFDFVLDTAKKYEKMILYSLGGIIVSGLVFMGADIYKQITPLGERIHGYLWPPALTIDSIPGEAVVFLKKDNGEIISQRNKTPVNIDKLVPGNYTLVLHKEGFQDIERRITVKGKDHIYASGSVYTKETQKNLFLFNFEVPLRINSNPPGATVYIDGKKLPRTTNVSQYVETGKHTIKLLLAGFEPLGSSDMTPSYGQCWIDLKDTAGKQKGLDHRYWTFNERMKKELKEYVLHGTFWKSLSIATDPSKAFIFIDNEKDNRGRTPVKDVRLTVGKHIIRITKKGYKTREQTIEISSETKDKLKYSLEKYIWFRSAGAGKPGKDLQALVTIKGTSVKKKKTPFRVALPLKNYKAVFSKGIRFVSKTVPFKVRSRGEVRATLTMRHPFIRIVTKAENSREPVSNAYILFNDIYQGSTNTKGTWESYVKPGTYTIKINTGERFPEISFTKQLELGTRQTEKVVLYAPSNCTLYIDTRPYFIGAQIYLDGVYQNETIRKITKMNRGSHTILIRHYDLEEDVETDIRFTKPKQTIKVKLNENGEFIIKEE